MSEETTEKKYVYSFAGKSGNSNSASSETADTVQNTAVNTVEKAEAENIPVRQDDLLVDPTPYTWDIVPPPRCHVKLRSRHRWLKAAAVILLMLAAGMTVLFLLAAEPRSAVPVHGSAPEVETKQILQLMRNKFAENTEHKTLQVKLTAEELNAYLPGIFDEINSGYKEDLQLNGSWENGKFEGVASIFYWKRYFNVRFTAEVLFQNNRLTLAISNSKIGRVPLPAVLLRKIEKKLLAALEADPDYQQVMKGVTHITVAPDGSLLLAINNNTAAAPDYEKNPVTGDFSQILVEKLLMPVSKAYNGKQKNFTTELTSDDVNVLFAQLLDNFYLSGKQDGEPDIYAVCQNNQFRIYATVVNEHKVSTVIYLAIKPEIKNGDVFVTVNELKIGNLQLPTKPIEKKLQKLLTRNIHKTGYNKIIQLCSLESKMDDQQKEKILNSIHSIVKMLSINEQGNLVIEADAEQARGLVQSMMSMM